MHAGLRRRIGRGRRRADRLQRPHRTGLHNSAALAACLHGLSVALRSEERVLEDVVEKTIVLSLGHLEERLRPEDACIVEQHVEPAKPIDRRLHQRLADRRKGDVADIPDSTLARGLDLMGGRFGFGGIATIDDYRAALSDKPARDLLAHPRSAAGNDSNLILETHDFPPWRDLPIDRLTR